MVAWEFRGRPVFFDQHAFDGARAEGITEEAVLEAMRRGTSRMRRSGRVEASYEVGRKVVLVRYDYVEDEFLGGYWYVVSVSRRAR